MTTVERGKRMHSYWNTAACSDCSIKAQCTTGKERRIKRWEHEDVLDAMQRRLDRDPGIMRVRRETVEHPFGTLKAWMGSTRFLTRTLARVSTEMSLHVLAYNLKRFMRIYGIEPLIEKLWAYAHILWAIYARTTAMRVVTKQSRMIIVEPDEPRMMSVEQTSLSIRLVAVTEQLPWVFCVSTRPGPIPDTRLQRPIDGVEGGILDDPNNLFVANWLSSFSALALRERRVNNRPTVFHGLGKWTDGNSCIGSSVSFD